MGCPSSPGSGQAPRAATQRGTRSGWKSIPRHQQPEGEPCCTFGPHSNRTGARGHGFLLGSVPRRPALRGSPPLPAHRPTLLVRAGTSCRTGTDGQAGTSSPAAQIEAKDGQRGGRSRMRSQPCQPYVTVSVKSWEDKYICP